MAESLVIRLPASPGAVTDWIAVDAAGAPVSELQTGPLAELRAAAEGRKVIALAPASSVLRTAVAIPLKGMAKIRQALPYALEEQLAGAVENQHFACSKKMADGLVPVAVVDRAALAEWKSALEDAGLHPTAVYAESDCIAAMPNTITIVADLDTVIVRDAAGIATVADHDSLEAILELLMSDVDDEPAPAVDDEAAVEYDADVGVETDADATQVALDPHLPPEPLNIVAYVHEERHEQHAMLFEMIRLKAASLDVKLLPDGALPRLASEIVNSGGVNLLQGEFAPKTELGIHWQHWRIAASLLLAVLVVMLLRTGVDYWQLSQTESTLDSAAQQLLGSTFPGTGDVADPWSELRSRLGTTESGTVAADAAGFAEAIEAVAGAFAKTADIELEAMSYRDGKLDVQLFAPDVERLDQLRQRIVEPGAFEAEIQSANPDDKRIKGRVKIFAAGGA